MKNSEYIKEKYNLEDLKAVVHKLTQPDGCPWDSVQTYESLCKYVTDEALEVVEAVKNNDVINLKEELGDLLLIVLMYSEIAVKFGDFTFDDVVDNVADKMVKRHPNVFGDNILTEEEKQLEQMGVSRWNIVKLKEKTKRLEEYQKMYEEGRITAVLLDLQKEKLEEFRKKIGIFNKNELH